MGTNLDSAGRWITTFATDVQPGDKIRRNGVERHVVTRDYPPSFQPTFRIEYGAGGESIAKLAIVAIWDRSRRLGFPTRDGPQGRSDPMTGNSGTGGAASGFALRDAQESDGRPGAPVPVLGSANRAADLAELKHLIGCYPEEAQRLVQRRNAALGEKGETRCPGTRTKDPRRVNYADVEELLKPREVAKMFGVGTSTVARWAREGRLIGLRTPGGHRRYSLSAIRVIITDARERHQPNGSSLRTPCGSTARAGVSARLPGNSTPTMEPYGSCSEDTRP